jgi:hypothetical protein
MAVAATPIGRPISQGNDIALISNPLVSKAVAHFAQTLPYRVRAAAEALAIEPARAEPNVALRHRTARAG